MTFLILLNEHSYLSPSSRAVFAHPIGTKWIFLGLTILSMS